MSNVLPRKLRFPIRSHLAITAAILVLVPGAIFFISKADRGDAAPQTDLTSQVKREPGRFYPTAAQWTSLVLQPIERHAFRSELVTEGKIAIDESRTTRLFSPYAGRVKKLLVEPGEVVQQGQLIFVVEAADSVDAQKEFVAAIAGVNKARSQVNLTRMVEQRMANLVKDKAMPLKDLQEAQANLTAAQSDLRSADIALQAVRNRLRLVGKTDEEIAAFENTGIITPDAPVYSPLSGTVLQRNVGPGQYLNAGASDAEPVFRIGDVSKLWLIAYVREADAANVQVGQTIRFTVLSHPGRVFESKVSYVASSLDSNSRRLLVRAAVDNTAGLLRPEMFANVTITVIDDSAPTAAVPREAIIYEGDAARVWVAVDDRTLELRQIELGISSGRLVQVLRGVSPGERVVTRGSLFIDRAATLGT